MKWIKLVFGIAATGVLASSTLALFPSEKYGLLLNNVMNNLGSDSSKLQPIPNDFLTTKGLITKQGFGYEQHKVKTEDGYILTLHRIRTDTPGGPPVVFQHGFIASSDSLLCQNRDRALAFLLADAGFDVWLPDQRGDSYSREHETYEPTDPRFWDFSFHESGYYDLPAYIDKVLNVTKSNQVFYIGYSMGTTVFMAMASVRPEYNQKIKAAVLLAPAVITPTLDEVISPAVKLILENADLIYGAFIAAGIFEFLPRAFTNIVAIRSLCSPSITQDLCLDIVGLGYGEHRDNLDKNVIGNQLSYLPAGSSSRTAHHLSQIYKKGFRLYDYGPIENLRRYNSEVPPYYPLQNVTAPVALYYGLNDVLVNKRGVMDLAKMLPNLIKTYEVPDSLFTHVDFVYGLNNKELVNMDVVNLLLSLL